MTVRIKRRSTNSRTVIVSRAIFYVRTSRIRLPKPMQPRARGSQQQLLFLTQNRMLDLNREIRIFLGKHLPRLPRIHMMPRGHATRLRKDGSDVGMSGQKGLLVSAQVLERTTDPATSALGHQDSVHSTYGRSVPRTHSFMIYCFS